MDIQLLDSKGQTVTIIQNIDNPAAEVKFFSKMYGAPLTWAEYTAPRDEPSIDQLREAKLADLNKAAAATYVAGFYSSASGIKLWYDSDVDTQNVLNRQFLIALSIPDVYSSTVFFAGLPAGVTPVRARPHATDPDSAKTVQLINAGQMVKLGTDLAAAWAGVKATLWGLQAKVYAATTADVLAAINWPAQSN